MKIRITNFKKMVNGGFIFSVGIDNLIYINGFRLIPNKNTFFLSLPQKKKGLNFENTVIIKKNLKDEIYNESMFRLNEYKKISDEDRIDVEIYPY